MKTRIISGLVYASLGTAAIVFNIFFGCSVTVAVTMIAIMCIYELYHCMEIPVNGIYFMVSEMFVTIVLILFMPNYSGVKGLNFTVQIVAFSLFWLATIINGITSRDGMRKSLLLGSITTLIVVAFTAPCILSLKSIYSGEGVYNIRGLLMLIILIAAPFMSDIAGYFVGVTLGKHKLAPIISPKKTWEGFVGSVIGSTFFLLLFGFVNDIFCELLVVNYISLFITGIIGSVVGTFGDLFFSTIKRTFKVKDFGSIIPGHGGMLDRFDSFIFTSFPIMLLFFVWPQFYLI